MVQTIIGYLTDDDTRYLLSAPDQNGLPSGQILDLLGKKLYPPMPLISLTAREDWEKYEGDQSILSGLLKGVIEVKPRSM